MAKHPLPHEPESLRQLRARYPMALDPPFDVSSVVDGSAPRPGELRRCVFDCRDGVRMVISRELGHPSGEVLHVSASLREGCPLWEMVRMGLLGPAEFVERVERRFREVSGDDRPLPFGGLSPDAGIPHWFRKADGQGVGR